MNILALPAGKTVMEFGEVGDNFYFILFGEVEIQIPDQNLL
jgi:CRP-like cAMP-binding protein